MTGPRRRAGLAPTLALLVGVAAAATVTPALVNDGEAPPRSPVPATPTTEAAPMADPPTTTTTEAPPTEAPPPEAPPSPGAGAPAPASLLRLRVVPAVRDVVVTIDGSSYASDADGLIEAPVDGADAAVEVVGYSVTPALQRVTFTGWADGSEEAVRTLAATGPDGVVELGVEVDYRITATATGASAVVLRDDAGTPRALPSDTPTWIPARRAVPGPDGTLAVEELDYQVEVGGQVRPERFTPTPEALVEAG